MCFVPDVYVVNACSRLGNSSHYRRQCSRREACVHRVAAASSCPFWYGVRAVLPRLWNTVHGLHYILAVPCRGGLGSMAVGAVAVWYGRKTVFRDPLMIPRAMRGRLRVVYRRLKVL